MKIEIQPFGTSSEGSEIQKVAFYGEYGSSAAFLTYGAIIQSVVVPNSCNSFDDVILGFDSIAPYENQGWNCGALIGRTCGRIRNGEIVIDGKMYILSQNQGKHHLHGGFKGFSRKIWNIESLSNDYVTMSCESKAGEEGYPGTMNMSVTYRFSEDSELSIEYEASTDHDTVCNPTNHVYFNLAGHSRNCITDHEMSIASSSIAERDEEAVITAVIASVEDRKEDFRSWKKIGNKNGVLEIESACYVLDEKGPLHRACMVREPHCGRQLEVSTSSSALLFYGGKYIRGSETGKDGVVYASHGGFCLETMEVCNSTVQSGCSILHAGDIYRQKTRFAFSVMNASNRNGRSCHERNSN
jgi:aldose 1-epimerase